MSRKKYHEEKMQKYVYIFSITLFISIIIFISIFTAYNKKLKETANKELSKLNKESKIVDNKELDEFIETSYSKDKDTKSSNSSNANNINTNNTSTKTTTANKNTQTNNTTTIDEVSVKDNNIDNINQTNTSDISENDNNTINENNKNSNDNLNLVANENSLENSVISFMAPVSGEILKDFSVDTLVYSNTLKEWTTHNGIDIKADKTSIVVSAESGTIESIKNDPRFGLTITIAHDNGFKTIYSNLLTTEFVKENEKVEKGQTIATVGESASFEVADEPHLHFEIYKDGEVINPTIYLKDV